MIMDLGFNLNAVVSGFLDPFHNVLEMDYYAYLGETNNYGVPVMSYAPAVTVQCQTQIPGSTQAKLVGKAIDIRNARIFYVNAEIQPTAAIAQRGGDLIVSKVTDPAEVWYVEAIQDDFRQVGWMSVIGVKTFIDVATLNIVDPEPTP